jgi:hypothetical protein
MGVLTSTFLVGIFIMYLEQKYPNSKGDNILDYFRYLDDL